MDFKKIACTAIRRWNEKRHTDKTAGTRRTTLPETQKPQPAQGVPTAQPVPAAHRLLHRHVLVQSAFRPFGKPQVHLRARGVSHRLYRHRPCANLYPTEGGIGGRGMVFDSATGKKNALRLHNEAFYCTDPTEEVLRHYCRAAQPSEKVRPRFPCPKYSHGYGSWNPERWQA